MPDDTAAIAASQTPPPAAPDAAPKGIDAMMAQLDAAAASGKTISQPGKPPETPPASPTPKPPEQKPAVPAAKPPAEPKAATPAKPPADDMDEAAMEKFLKQHQKPWRVYEAAKKGWQTKIQQAEAKIKDLENKPTITAADQQKYELLTKQIEEYKSEGLKAKQELSKRDFTASDEYQKNFVEKANTIYGEAVAFVKQLQVGEGDGSRPATQSDFDELRALPLGARRKAAVDKFGDYAGDVLGYVRDIDNIKRDATMAQQRHAENYERELAERETTTAKQRQEYDGFYKSALEGIQKNENYGKWFSPNPEDAEASQLLADGFNEIEKVAKEVGGLSLADQAAHAAVYRARAAATPRLILEINRRDSKISELEAELAKFRGSDPGAHGKGGEGGAGDAPKKGISDAVAVFDQMPRY